MAVFLKRRSDILEPLHKLLQKDVPWEWTTEHEEAYKASKGLLTTDDLLVHYDEKLPLILTSDASSYGLGSVLSHLLPNGKEAPVAYYSRTMTKTERNYSQTDKEALAILAGVKKFHSYLLGRRFKIVTDHRPLLGIFNSTKPIPQMISPRVLRWSLSLQAYDYELEYRKGKDIANTDALSRLPVSTPEFDVPQPADIFYSGMENSLQLGIHSAGPHARLFRIGSRERDAFNAAVDERACSRHPVAGPAHRFRQGKHSPPQGPEKRAAQIERQDLYRCNHNLFIVSKWFTFGLFRVEEGEQTRLHVERNHPAVPHVLVGPVAGQETAYAAAAHVLASRFPLLHRVRDAAGHHIHRASGTRYLIITVKKCLFHGGQGGGGCCARGLPPLPFTPDPRGRVRRAAAFAPGSSARATRGATPSEGGPNARGVGDRREKSPVAVSRTLLGFFGQVPLLCLNKTPNSVNPLLFVSGVFPPPPRWRWRNLADTVGERPLGRGPKKMETCAPPPSWEPPRERDPQRVSKFPKRGLPTPF
ncbi:hypothetical protein JTE90_002920 [Oedothorax gibbosus]|uniref:Reverse transcriptase RNase H-like domain-containing protein n=1 Tax=Oedothorax gibbosus TaxID=931172 RepID=A0AAV6TM41_9ARAC|nr:hypothetical protein JTE90_002920 [Oedothorax gibbosus]